MCQNGIKKTPFFTHPLAFCYSASAKRAKKDCLTKNVSENISGYNPKNNAPKKLRKPLLHKLLSVLDVNALGKRRSVCAHIHAVDGEDAVVGGAHVGLVGNHVVR